MKKFTLLIILLIILLILLLCFTLLSSYKSQSANNYISTQLEIHISSNIKITLTDTHGGFLGDGTTYTKIKFTKKSAESILNEIKQSNHWTPLPLTENLHLIMYGGTKDTRLYLYNLANEHDIPLIHHGYWIFLDRHDQKITFNTDKELFNRSSFNFTLAIYDTDTNSLYYLEFDT